MLIAAYLAMQAGKIQKNNLAHCLRNNDPVIYQRADLPAYCLFGEARLIGDFSICTNCQFAKSGRAHANHNAAVQEKS